MYARESTQDCGKHARTVRQVLQRDERLQVNPLESLQCMNNRKEVSMCELPGNSLWPGNKYWCRVNTVVLFGIPVFRRWIQAFPLHGPPPPGMNVRVWYESQIHCMV